jgi:hypothetical protein
MKLRDITEGVGANVTKISKFLSDFEVTQYLPSTGTNIWYHQGGKAGNGLIDFMNHRELKVNEGINLITIAPEDETTFYWPFAHDAYHGGISIDRGTENKMMIVNDFQDFPDVDYLGLNCIVKSFKGIEKLKRCKTLELDFFLKFDGGILSLLKFDGNIHGIAEGEFQDEKVDKAMKILGRHINGNKNIADCMDELMEAGLKEYAKL